MTFFSLSLSLVWNLSGSSSLVLTVVKCDLIYSARLITLPFNTLFRSIEYFRLGTHR
jgi:hypothetical protein